MPCETYILQQPWWEKNYKNHWPQASGVKLVVCRSVRIKVKFPCDPRIMANKIGLLKSWTVSITRSCSIFLVKSCHNTKAARPYARLGLGKDPVDNI